MATRRSHRGDTPPKEETTSTRHREDSSEANGNGAANGAVPAEGAPRPAMERAEEMADRVGERLGHFASVIGRKFLQLVARAREEAEDIWAEAQDIRRRNREQRGSDEDPKV